jgi:HD-GYP domain-containing protein (c-di-GMP phosphodiesterase class II)
MTEELLLSSKLESLSVSSTNQIRIRRYLDLLGERDEPTRRHSIRVGARAAEAAPLVMGEPAIQPKMMLWAGLLHDVGKILVDPDLLRKTGTFTAEDYGRMEPHVEYGWRMVREIHPVTASILLWHHQFGPHPYPATLPPLPPFLEGKGELIKRAGRLLALADYFDALTTRDNAKFGGKLSAEEKRANYLKANQDELDLILRLEQARVFVF